MTDPDFRPRRRIVSRAHAAALCLLLCGEAAADSLSVAALAPDESKQLATLASSEARVTIALGESGAELINPERGYYVGMNLLSPGDAARVRRSGHSLAVAIVRLDAYRSQPLDAALLASLERGFAAARAAGIKVILRFTYNAAFQADAPRAQILGHIAQLAPLLQANSDVIAVMQAGFIGAWGEWHHSTNGLDNTADRAAVLNAILQALPESRAVQVRRPMFKASILPKGALSAAEAYSGSPRARVGHHNDCFLSSRSDSGTYASPVATWKAFVAADGRYTPVGGETCVVSSRTDCLSAVAEMTSNHWSFLNDQHNDQVVAAWRAKGCGYEIRDRLGYRFAVQRVTHDAQVRPGGVLDFEVEIVNRGFASPFNFRSVYVVLKGKGKRQVARLSAVDPRRWAPGEVSRLKVRLRVPADTTPGTYALGLWLPDEASSLRSDPRYAIRLANDGVWAESTGDNLLSGVLEISATAPGPVDATARSFAELP